MRSDIENCLTQVNAQQRGVDLSTSWGQTLWHEPNRVPALAGAAPLGGFTARWYHLIAIL